MYYQSTSYKYNLQNPQSENKEFHIASNPKMTLIYFRREVSEFRTKNQSEETRRYHTSNKARVCNRDRRRSNEAGYGIAL